MGALRQFEGTQAPAAAAAPPRAAALYARGGLPVSTAKAPRRAKQNAISPATSSGRAGRSRTSGTRPGRSYRTPG
jgi:hypothetical protein